MKRLRRAGEFITRQIAGELMLVPVARARAELDDLLVLEGIGPVVWEMLEAGPTEEELVAAITERFEVPAEEAREDLREFLAGLKEAGAVSEED